MDQLNSIWSKKIGNKEKNDDNILINTTPKKICEKTSSQLSHI